MVSLLLLKRDSIMMFEKITGDACEGVVSLEGEFWVDVLGYEGLYKVSNLGRVVSLARVVMTTRGPRKYKDKLMRPTPDALGYPRTSLTLDYVKDDFIVHRLMLQSFTGCDNSRLMALHNNGDSTDCRLDNVRWGTPKENSADKSIHGTQPKGIEVTNSKLTEEDVLIIRLSSSSCADMSRLFEVSPSVIFSIRKNKTWKHLPDLKPLGGEYEDGGRVFNQEQASLILGSSETNRYWADKLNVGLENVRRLRKDSNTYKHLDKSAGTNIEVKSGSHAFKDEQVLEILKCDKPNKYWAGVYNVGSECIRRLRKGQTYKHLYDGFLKL